MKFRWFFFIIVSFFFSHGCSTKKAIEPASEINASYDEESTFENEFANEAINTIDPLSGYNRAMTSFNDIFFIYALNPVAKTYGYVVPQPVRIGLSNFVENITFPIRFANNLLQGKFFYAGEELERFVINSTIGIGGVMDPATQIAHIASHDEDFGQTLGYYGAGSGFPIVIPFLGQSNLRDTAGLVADWQLSPIVYTHAFTSYKIPNNNLETFGIASLYILNRTSLNLGKYEDLKKDALDLYPFLRDTYEQKRDAQIDE
ncbi:MAG: lipid asymmetry transporter MlaABCDEF, lipoprotein MlaA [Pseudomonadota bacterium]